MPTWAKILIIVGLVIVLGVIAVVAGGVWWWSRNKDSIIARGKTEMTEGRDLGRTTDNQGCVDQSVLRYKKEPGFTSVIATTIFMRSCLDVSRPTAGFCDNVPKQTEFTKSAQWRVEQCERVDLRSDTYCQQLFSQVQDYCTVGSLRREIDRDTPTP
jgi:hypothetical protein